ncbi:hypothetical protein ACFU3J_18430 [Streptomyces sp. NPDC057411]|uniref:hypothetical protein n=1 Tax=unclassified Streptomyces TaxID=2593676 RepID=UPI00363421BA
MEAQAAAQSATSRAPLDDGIRTCRRAIVLPPGPDGAESEGPSAVPDGNPDENIVRGED